MQRAREIDEKMQSNIDGGINKEIGTAIDREVNRKSKQIDKQRDRPRDKHTDRETPTERERERVGDGQTNIRIDRLGRHSDKSTYMQASLILETHQKLSTTNRFKRSLGASRH